MLERIETQIKPELKEEIIEVVAQSKYYTTISEFKRDALYKLVQIEKAKQSNQPVKNAA